ncbi:hypothetical protein QUB63_20190 [Microcoleus sp. ARI1-B5]|uniref:hypothetical protein n=1 Tax=unclassified Microcoleus TaxID=2642155 RepID=UPI002FCEB0E4
MKARNSGALKTIAEIIARKPSAVRLGEELPASPKSTLWQVALLLTCRTCQLSGFGTELIFNAKMLEVGVILIVQKL